MPPNSIAIMYIPEPTVAERLIDLAEAIKHPRDELIICPAHEVVDESTYARIALALKLLEQPRVIILRAIVEDWSPQRIMREIH